MSVPRGSSRKAVRGPAKIRIWFLHVTLPKRNDFISCSLLRTRELLGLDLTIYYPALNLKYPLTLLSLHILAVRQCHRLSLAEQTDPREQLAF
jgi:hypothetical protein